MIMMHQEIHPFIPNLHICIGPLMCEMAPLLNGVLTPFK